MKKLFVSLLCVVMMVTFMPSMAFADGVTEEVETTLPEADAQGVIVLDKDYRVESLERDGKYDLNGNTLTVTGENTIYPENGETLEIKDSSVSETERGGKLIFESKGAATKADISPQAGGTVAVSNIVIESPNSVFYPKGNAAAVNITNCDVSAGCYCVATNASSDENGGVQITLEDSIFIAESDDGDNCPVMINVAGVLNINNCQITGDRQAVLVRAGTATIKNSSITTTGKFTETKGDDNWASGNEVKMGALVVGNNTNSTAYNAKANVSVEDSKIVSEKETVSAVFVNANNREGYGTELKITGEDTEVTGAFSKYERATQGNIKISGGTFSKLPSIDFFDDNFVPVINKDGGCSVYTKEYADSNFVQDNDGNYFESNEAAGVMYEAKVGETFYNTLEAAVAAAEGGTVTLLKDVTLDEPLVISKSITLVGKHSITGAAGTARVILVDGEDIDVTLVDIEIVNGGGKHGLLVQNGSVTANDVSIDNSKTTGGAPVIVNPGTTANFNGLTLTLGESSWYGVNVDGATATFAGVTVTDETLQPTQSVICAEGAEPKVTGSDLTAVTTEVDGGKSQKQIAYVADQNLSQFVAAKTEAQKNVSKIELNSDVELTDPLVISEEMEIVGNNHAIKGTSALGKENVVTVMANGVTLSGITIETDVANKSGLHIYKTTDTELTNVKVIVKGSGAGILVNGAEVTVNGKLDFVLGENSWGGINVEAKDDKTPKVNFNDGSKVTVKGDKPAIYQDEENVIEGKAEITGAEDAGLKQNADGSYEVEDTTSGGGGGIIIPPAAQHPTIEVDDHVKVTLGSDGTTATITVDEGYELADVVLNGVSQGKITFVYGLKTGDVLKVTTVKKGETEAEKNARLKAGVENTTIKLKSTLGKGYIKLNWTKSKGYKVDKYQVFRSTKRYSGYGTKAYFTTKQGGLKAWYKNTKELKKGNRYYYKVRGVREIADETVYTQWSNKAWRTIK